MAGANRPMSASEWGSLLALAILWSTPFLFSRIAVEHLPPLTVVLGRVGLAALALNAFVLATGRRLPRAGSTWGSFAVMGLLNNVIPFGLIVWGQTRIPSGLASILNAMTPLWVILVAHALTRDERITARRLTGVAIGIGGAVVVIGPAALEGLGGAVLGQLAVVGATVSYAFAGVYGRRFRGLSPLLPATGQVTASALLLLPLVAVVDRPWEGPAPDRAAVGAIVGLAVLCTAVAYVLYFRILATAGATNLLLVTFLMPVGAVVLGAVFLDEQIEGRQLAGMMLIFAGLAVVDGRPLRLLGPARRRVLARS